MKNYKKLEDNIRKIAHLSNICDLAHWDAATGLPVGATENRHREIASFKAVIHELSTSKELGELIEASFAEKNDLDDMQRVNLNLVKKKYNSQICVSTEIQKEYSIVSFECEFIWRKARRENDFKSLIPYQDKVFNSVRKIAELKAEALGKSPMDALIDMYDHDRTSVEIDNTFDKLKAELPKLIEKIIEKQKSEKILPLTEPIDENTQKNIGLKIMEKMGFNMDCGRLDKSVHPFCSGSNDDVRSTTRYDVNNFLSSLFGVIHEAGHGLYQQNLPAKYRDQPIGSHMGMAFHESQSLIMEMQAGMSKPFTAFLAELLRDEFSFVGPEYSEENLYKLITKVTPSFIRVDADEATYPLHIILRYEIEKEILENNLAAKDLPALWNAKMKEYLGIVPDADSKGCMQDIHWPSGGLGYFPSYTNGAIIASMLMKKAKTEYESIDAELRTGDFSSLNKFLNERLRNSGSSRSSADLLKYSTGHSEIRPDIFIDYLRAKYL